MVNGASNTSTTPFAIKYSKICEYFFTELYHVYFAHYFKQKFDLDKVSQAL